MISPPCWARAASATGPRRALGPCLSITSPTAVAAGGKPWHRLALKLIVARTSSAAATAPAISTTSTSTSTPEAPVPTSSGSGAMQASTEQLIARIHANASKVVLYTTGGAVQAPAWLLCVPGASNTVLECSTPYARDSLVDVLGAEPQQYCSQKTAVDMAIAAYRRAAQLTNLGTHIVGLGATCALATVPPKRGDHRAYLACHDGAGGTHLAELTLSKGLRTRMEEDGIASLALLQLLAKACGEPVSGPPLFSSCSSSASSTSTSAASSPEPHHAHANNASQNSSGSTATNATADGLIFTSPAPSASNGHRHRNVGRNGNTAVDGVNGTLVSDPAFHHNNHGANNASGANASTTADASSRPPAGAAHSSAGGGDGLGGKASAAAPRAGDVFLYRHLPAPDPLQELLAGRVRCVEFAGGQVVVDAPRRGKILLPGSFNPLHRGHTALLKASARAEGGTKEAAFELSVGNADKGTLPLDEVQRRVQQFVDAGLPVVVTSAPLFTHKAALLPESCFVVGYDTAARMVLPKYYGGSDAQMYAEFERLRRAGCRFLVAGRKDSGSGEFKVLGDVPMPHPLADLFTGLDEEHFRVDMSSTELRAQRSVSAPL